MWKFYLSKLVQYLYLFTSQTWASICTLFQRLQIRLCVDWDIDRSVYLMTPSCLNGCYRNILQHEGRGKKRQFSPKKAVHSLAAGNGQITVRLFVWTSKVSLRLSVASSKQGSGIEEDLLHIPWTPLVVGPQKNASMAFLNAHSSRLSHSFFVSSTWWGGGKNHCEIPAHMRHSACIPGPHCRYIGA